MLGYQLIGDVTVDALTQFVSFTGLNITKDDDYVIVADIYNSTGITGQAIALFVNDNTNSANYYTQDIKAADTTLSAQRQNIPAIGGIDTLARSLIVANIKLTNSGYFVGQAHTLRGYQSSSMYMLDRYVTSTFTLSSITKIDIGSATQTLIGVGSRFQLYKCIAEKVADITVGTAVTSVDITGLNIDKTSEYMLVSDIVNAGTASDYSLFSNATTTGYATQYLSANAATIALARASNSIFTNVAASAKNCVITNIKLTHKSGYIVLESWTTATYSSSSLYLLYRYGSSTFTATSITQLTITSVIATQIGIGSRFQLYKLK